MDIQIVKIGISTMMVGTKCWFWGFKAVFRLFLTLFWVIFSPIGAALDPFWACGIILGYTPAYFGKNLYLQTQKFEVGHLLLKNHFWVGYRPLGENFVEKWGVDKKNCNWQRLGIEKTFQKLYGYPNCEYWNFYNDGLNQMLILMFFCCFSLFLTIFWVIFSPISDVLDPLGACGGE